MPEGDAGQGVKGEVREEPEVGREERRSNGQSR